MSNEIVVKPNGPLIARGRIRVEDANGDLLTEGEEVFFCRCGQSGNKPFCDGAHKQCGFTDTAEIRDERGEPPGADAPLVIQVRENAMLLAKGPMTVRNAANTFLTTRNKAAFCRCGQSANKPFCDASHKQCGFQAP
jgi:CDGSH-type Zn-finger protein